MSEDGNEVVGVTKTREEERQGLLSPNPEAYYKNEMDIVHDVGKVLSKSVDKGTHGGLGIEGWLRSSVARRPPRSPPTDADIRFSCRSEPKRRHPQGSDKKQSRAA